MAAIINMWQSVAIFSSVSAKRRKAKEISGGNIEISGNGIGMKKSMKEEESEMAAAWRQHISNDGSSNGSINM